MREDTVNIVGTIVMRHINQLCAHIPHRTMFVDEVLYQHIAGNRQRIGCLNKVEVTVKNTGNGRRKRQYGEHLFQFKAVHAERDILQGSGITVIRINLDTGSISGLQLHIGRQTFVVTNKDIVTVIDLKLLIANCRYG